MSVFHEFFFMYDCMSLTFTSSSCHINFPIKSYNLLKFDNSSSFMLFIIISDIFACSISLKYNFSLINRFIPIKYIFKRLLSV